MNEDIAKALSVLRTNLNSGDEEVHRELVSQGVERERAARLVEFLPMIYCRVILRHSGAQFSNTFLRKLPGGGVEERLLSSYAIWNAGLAFAYAEVERGISGEDLLSVAARSAEFDAANQLLNRGSKLDDIVFAPPILPWSENGP